MCGYTHTDMAFLARVFTSKKIFLYLIMLMLVCTTTNTLNRSAGNLSSIVIAQLTCECNSTHPPMQSECVAQEKSFVAKRAAQSSETQPRSLAKFLQIRECFRKEQNKKIPTHTHACTHTCNPICFNVYSIFSIFLFQFYQYVFPVLFFSEAETIWQRKSL